MPNIKSSRPSAYGKEDFSSLIKICPFLPLFGPYVQWTGTISTTLKEGHPRNIPAKFHQHWPSGLGEEVILMKKLTHARTNARMHDGHHGVTKAHLEHVVLR